MGWYNALDEETKSAINAYFHATPATIKTAILHYSMHSQAEFVIIPVQDILGLDESSRLNAPGTVGSPNWEWKLADFSGLKQEVHFMAHEVTQAKR